MYGLFIVHGSNYGVVQVEIKRAVKKEEMGGGPVGGGGGGAGGGGGYVGGAGGPVRGGKEPDWICPDQNCSNKNFGWRQACNRCQVLSQAAIYCSSLQDISGTVATGQAFWCLR